MAKAVIAHGGKCPNGYIYDHNPKHDTYGKCIPLVGKLAKESVGKKKRLSEYAK